MQHIPRDKLVLNFKKNKFDDYKEYQAVLINIFEGNPLRNGVIKYYVVLISRNLLTVLCPARGGRHRERQKGYLFL